MSFQVAIQVLMDSVSSSTEECTPRRSHLAVSSPNQRSTRFTPSAVCRGEMKLETRVFQLPLDHLLGLVR